MSNLLSYTLSIQDQMSAKLSSIGFSSEGMLNKFVQLEKKSREVSQVLRETGNSVGALKQKVDLLKAERDWIPQSNITAIKATNSEIQKLERQITRLETTTKSGGGIGGMIGNAFQQIPFAGLLMNPLIMAGVVGGKALTLGIESEMQNTSFEVLLGSQEAAKGLIDDIAEYAKKTPFEKMGLGDAAKTMLGFGIAQDKVMPTLAAIGDVSMGNKDKMSSLTLAYSQMSATGRLMGQDLNQMINAGFNPLGEISKKTGKSIGQLKKEMEDGKISSKMVEDAFISATSAGGQFYGMADKMSTTLGGRWSTFMDNVSEKLLVLYGALEPVASLVLNYLNVGLEASANGMSWMVDKFNEGNPIMLVAVGVILSLATAMGIMKAASMAQAGWTAAVTLANNMQTASWWQLNAAMLANPTTWIIAGVIALIALIGFLAFKVDGWGQAWDHTMKAGKLVIQGFVESVKLYFNIMVGAVMTALNFIMAGWYKFKEAVGIGDSSENQKMIAKINADTEARKKAVVDGAKKIKALGLEAGNEMLLAGGSLKVNNKTLGDFKDTLTSKLGIGAPSIPGTAQGVKNPFGGSKEKTEKSNTATATGGTKHNYITISIKEINGLKDVIVSSKEAATKAGSEVADELLRILAMATTATG